MRQEVLRLPLHVQTVFELAGKFADFVQSVNRKVFFKRAIAQFVSQSQEHASEIFVHIDPYGPLERARNNLNSIDLFFDLRKIGVKTILWYGYNSQEREIFRKVTNKTLTSKKLQF